MPIVSVFERILVVTVANVIVQETESTGNPTMRSRTTMRPLCMFCLITKLKSTCLHFSHHLCIMTLQDKLFSAPLKDPKTILDLGTPVMPRRETSAC